MRSRSSSRAPAYFLNFLPLSYRSAAGWAPPSPATLPGRAPEAGGPHVRGTPRVLYHVQALRRGDRVGGSGTPELYSTPREKIDAARIASTRSPGTASTTPRWFEWTS